MAFFGMQKRRPWRQVRRDVEQRQPILIGIVGSGNVALTAAAIALALQATRSVHVSAATRKQPPALGEASVAVVGLSTERPGDIKFLGEQLPWNIVIATRVASENLALFGSKETVAHEHTSLVSALGNTSYAILNADDELVANMAYHTPAHVVFFGGSARSHVRLVRSAHLPTGGFAVEVAVGQRHYQFSLPNLLAFSQVLAALAALAVADLLNVDIETAATKVSELQPSRGELSPMNLPQGAKVIDASASATPEAMLSALHTLTTLRAKRKIAILGDIVDLGSEAVGMHRKIGRAAAESAHVFVAVGSLMRQAAGEALKRRSLGFGSTSGPDVHQFETSAEVGPWLKSYLTPNDVILVMGSPDMHLERIVTDLSS